MNCKQVQELLPLFVACDLEEKRAKLVMAHLQSCAECVGAVDEYRETRQLLQKFSPPPFSEAVYAGIRQRVLREIGRESNSPSLPQLVASLFRPRIRWAVATALLLAVSVFSFYFIANRRPNLTNDSPQIAGSSRRVDQTKPNEQPNPRPQGSAVSAPSPSFSSRGSSPLTRSARNTGAGPTSAGPHQFQRRKISGGAADRPTSVAANTRDPRSIAAEASPEGNNLAEPEAVLARDPAASEKTLRVEMQTKDPNIRIIWFSSQRTKQDSPGKFSKGI